MNITIITPLLPFPLDSGGAQAQYNMIDALRNKHQFVLIYPENCHNSSNAMLQLKRLWPNVTFAPYSYARQYANLPFVMSKAKRMFNLLTRNNSRQFKAERIIKPYGYDLSRRFKKFITATLEKSQADVVQIEFYPFMPLIDAIPDNCKTVFVHHEIRYVRNLRMMQPLQPTPQEQAYMFQLKDEEIQTLNKYNTVITLTDTDRDILQRDGVSTHIEVSPAAISSQVSRPDKACSALFFIGGFGHAPNQEGMRWLTGQVLPRIKKSLAAEHIALHIIGKGWQNVNVPSGNGIPVVLHGFVNQLADVAKEGIMLVPVLSGSGMRMKILEGAALGLPIVTTTVGVEGLPFKHQESCLIADTPEDFANAIVHLAGDQELRMTLATNAQTVFQQHFSKEALAQKRNQIYSSL